MMTKREDDTAKCDDNSTRATSMVCVDGDLRLIPFIKDAYV